MRARKQSNKRIAEQMEAARRTQMAKGEVGIRDQAPVPTLAQFADADFLPFVEAKFQAKPNTLGYYRNGIQSLNNHGALAGCKLDAITADKIAGFVAALRDRGLTVASINRRLEVLRRMLKLATEWGQGGKNSPESGDAQWGKPPGPGAE